MRRVVLVLVFLLLVPAFALAQSAKDSWDNLKQLASGQQIQIVLNDAKSYSGQFQSVSDDGIVLRLGKDSQTFKRQSVLRVSTKGASHRARNALIGAGVGAGSGGRGVWRLQLPRSDSMWWNRRRYWCRDSCARGRCGGRCDAHGRLARHLPRDQTLTGWPAATLGV